ncbi:MAG: 3-phosphoshikimate 1-carboxyvinyltransferase [Verrucomicrobiia bacterium]|jgi:3-phosphoshikimate 1-carboxyvinyltransferase
MSLGDLIEIMPLKEPVSARITVPGSKSITNRALVLAALADGPVVLRGALWSEDTEVMVNCLRVLGFEIKVDKDPEETGNRIIRVIGRCGIVPNSGTSDEPLELFVGNAGTAARFLSALVCLGEGTFRLSGIDRMHERPQAALFEALRQLGYRIDAENDRLPAVIHGSGPRAGSCKVRIDQSSQFASALLLLARRGGWTVEIDAYDPDQAPYVTMTEELISGFPLTGGALIIEPDTSSASYFIGANGLLTGFDTASEPLVWVKDWPDSTWQIDTAFPEFMGIDRKSQRAEFSRATDLGDSIMTAIALAPFFPIRSQFNDLGRLRVQECERVEALCTELTRCGASVEEEGDTLRIEPTTENLHGAEIETYNDHRMAMCFAVLGLKVPGLKIKNPGCVKKTFPNFFQKLAAVPPAGLGVEIRDGITGDRLSHEDLFAE